ncbi:hypothetical protein NKH18_38435 [Streptomyces sp. M10(2022)]
MSFEEEWAGLKAEAAARMQLNSVPTRDPDASSTGADLVVHDDELGKIGHFAYRLHNNLKADGKHARTTSRAAGTSLTSDGFEMGKALTSASTAWVKQVETLLNACAHISNHLDYTKASKKKDDDWVAAQVGVSKSLATTTSPKRTQDPQCRSHRVQSSDPCPFSSFFFIQARCSMLVFQQLLNLRTKPLDSAIDDWVAMTKKLRELAKDAGDMSVYAQGTAWKGQNAGVTKPFVTRTAGEFQDAVTQAESITNLLEGAYSELKKAKAELVEIYESPPYGLKIDPYGVVIHLESADPDRSDVDALVKRMEAILQRAADADARCTGVWRLSPGPASVQLRALRLLEGRENTQGAGGADETGRSRVRAPEKWGSGTIKPVAEFLSYRSWMGGGEALLRGDLNGAVQGFIGGTPAYAAGEASKHLEKGSILSDVKGVHHRPTALNTVGKFGEDLRRARRRGGDSGRLRLHPVEKGAGDTHGCPGSAGEGEVPMKHGPGTPPSGRRRAGPPPPGRRRPSARHLLRPGVRGRSSSGCACQSVGSPAEYAPCWTGRGSGRLSASSASGFSGSFLPSRGS